MIEWRSFGDINPIPHGGKWVERHGVEYHVITVDMIEENIYVVNEYWVDLTASWIDIDAVKSFADTPENDEYFLAGDVISYYSRHEFDGERFDNLTDIEAIKCLSVFGIVF